MSLERASVPERLSARDAHLDRTGTELLKLLRRKFSDLFGVPISQETGRKHIHEALRKVVKDESRLFLEPLSLAEQQEVAEGFTASFSTGTNTRYSFVNRVEYLDKWRNAVDAALVQDEHASLETSPLFSLNSVFELRELASLHTGEGLPGVFELIDARRHPLPDAEERPIYYEFGISPRGVVANRISRSGEILDANLSINQFKASAKKYGGKGLRRLTGTHSSTFDFSPVSSKR